MMFEIGLLTGLLAGSVATYYFIHCPLLKRIASIEQSLNILGNQVIDIVKAR